MFFNISHCFLLKRILFIFNNLILLFARVNTTCNKKFYSFLFIIEQHILVKVNISEKSLLFFQSQKIRKLYDTVDGWQYYSFIMKNNVGFQCQKRNHIFQWSSKSFWNVSCDKFNTKFIWSMFDDFYLFFFW